MSRARGLMAAMVALVGLGTAAWPAVALQFGADQEPLTKWMRGETHPAVSGVEPPTSPTAGPMPAWPEPTTETAAVETPTPTVGVESRLEPKEARCHLGEAIHLYVELSWIGQPHDVLPEAPQEPTLLNLEKKGMAQKSSVVPEAGQKRAVVTYHFVLQPVEEGAASIEPITIRYRYRGADNVLQLTTDRFALTILPCRRPWGKILLGTVGGLAVIGGLLAASAWLAARARRARQAAQSPPPRSPYETLRGELDGVRRLLTEGSTKEAYGAVERFIRQALGQRLGTDLRHATIEELTAQLESAPIDSAIRDRADSILDRCGQVKFAGYVPTVADQNQIIADSRLLLDDLEKEAPAATAMGEVSQAKMGT